jgi:thymidylate synthase (FAD)
VISLMIRPGLTTYLLGSNQSKLRRAYDSLINAGVAPEQARAVLPQSMYTSYYATGSLAAWARFYNLRAAPDAQV